jgi:hypothetical protein
MWGEGSALMKTCGECGKHKMTTMGSGQGSPPGGSEELCFGFGFLSLLSFPLMKQYFPQQQNNSLSSCKSYFLLFFSKRQVPCETCSCLFRAVYSASACDLMEGPQLPRNIIAGAPERLPSLGLLSG